MDKSPQLICGARGRACARRAHPRDRRWSRYLAAKLLFSEAVKHWTMVDPNPVSTFAIPDLDIVKSYVEDLGKLPHEIDCVVHSHTLEHMYDPARFFDAPEAEPGAPAPGYSAWTRPRPVFTYWALPSAACSSRSRDQCAPPAVGAVIRVVAQSVDTGRGRLSLALAT